MKLSRTNHHIISRPFVSACHSPIIPLSFFCHAGYTYPTIIVLSLTCWVFWLFLEKSIFNKTLVINLSLNYHQDIINLSFSCHHFERVGRWSEIRTIPTRFMQLSCDCHRTVITPSWNNHATTTKVTYHWTIIKSCVWFKKYHFLERKILSSNNYH